MSPIVATSKDRCRRCYSCVRRCPAKAIRVRAGQAEIIPERCVACGRCVRECTQNAKQVVDNLPYALEKIASGHSVVMLAPSFAAACAPFRPSQLIAALRRAGFVGVYEVAFGAELVAQLYRARYERNPDDLTITSPCPAAIGFIQKFAPELIAYLSPILSPMAAMGKAIKQRIRPGVSTVFVGPCTAKIEEIRHPDVAPWVDVVLTFPEMHELLRRSGVGDWADIPDDDFDPPHSLTGGIFPVPRGLIRTADLPDDLLDNDIADVVGTDAFSDVVERLQQRVQHGTVMQLETRFFDVLFCRGCLAGPMMPGAESPLVRKERVVAWMRSRRSRLDLSQCRRELQSLVDLDLSRSFEADTQSVTEPTAAELRQILARTGKLTPADELNCRACGYRSCREKARAVFNGLAEVDMCLPYMIDRLEGMVESLNKSHTELTEAQTQLIRSERLASMGQLAAGIAHEVNNPLGTILIYAHLLAEQLQSGQPLVPETLVSDAQMILGEATRCKSIVGGLLDFARQNKVNRTLVDISSLLHEAVAIVGAGRDDAIQYEVNAPAELPHIMIDRDQMLQVLLNIVRNAVEVMNNEGTIRVSAELLEARRELRVSVRDTGPGMSPETMQKMFTPFYTTKPVGKGTGLGLPICYGVVKMHRGTLSAHNNSDGVGATFEIFLPYVVEEPSNGAIG